MRSTVSAKETERHGSRCDACGLWFLYLHPGADGRFMCRLCLALEAGTGPRRWRRTSSRSELDVEVVLGLLLPR
jgi:hypothetical protein